MEDVTVMTCKIFHPVHTKAAKILYQSTDPQIKGDELYVAFRHIHDDILRIGSDDVVNIMADVSTGISTKPICINKTVAE